MLFDKMGYGTGVGRRTLLRLCLTGQRGRISIRTPRLGRLSPVAAAELTEDKLRCGFQAIGSESCVPEDVTFDVTGHGFGVAFWLVEFVTVIEVIRAQAIKSHVWPPDVVPAFELGTEARHMVKSLDQRHAS